jgi:hypothetical protein
VNWTISMCSLPLSPCHITFKGRSINNGRFKTKLESFIRVLRSRLCFLGFEVLTRVVMTFSIFWGIMPCSLYMNQRFRGTYRLHLQSKNQPRKKPACNRIYAALFLVWFSTPKMEAIRSSEMSVHTQTSRRDVLEDVKFRCVCIWNVILPSLFLLVQCFILLIHEWNMSLFLE